MSDRGLPPELVQAVATENQRIQENNELVQSMEQLAQFETISGIDDVEMRIIVRTGKGMEVTDTNESVQALQELKDSIVANGGPLLKGDKGLEFGGDNGLLIPGKRHKFNFINRPGEPKFSLQIDGSVLNVTELEGVPPTNISSPEREIIRQHYLKGSSVTEISRFFMEVQKKFINVPKVSRYIGETLFIRQNPKMSAEALSAKLEKTTPANSTDRVVPATPWGEVDALDVTGASKSVDLKNADVAIELPTDLGTQDANTRVYMVFRHKSAVISDE